VELTERGVPRAEYAIVQGGAAVGALTSGGMAPTLNKPIGMGYVSGAGTAPGTAIAIEIRGKPVAAVIAALPFYKRPR
jgi:aminomethyltransferase